MPIDRVATTDISGQHSGLEAALQPNQDRDIAVLVTVAQSDIFSSIF
jgi:hypothetical protein